MNCDAQQLMQHMKYDRKARGAHVWSVETPLALPVHALVMQPPNVRTLKCMREHNNVAAFRSVRHS